MGDWFHSHPFPGRLPSPVEDRVCTLDLEQSETSIQQVDVPVPKLRVFSLTAKGVFPDVDLYGSGRGRGSWLVR